jgi:hypothetical protein
VHERFTAQNLYQILLKDTQIRELLEKKLETETPEQREQWQTLCELYCLEPKDYRVKPKNKP